MLEAEKKWNYADLKYLILKKTSSKADYMRLVFLLSRQGLLVCLTLTGFGRASAFFRSSLFVKALVSTKEKHIYEN